MANTKKRTLLWSAGGLLLSLLVVFVVVTGLAGQVLITDPEGIAEATDDVMNSVRKGDWEALSLLVSGDPVLEPATGEAGSAENRIWNAYQQSLQWTCKEDFGVQGAHVTQRVTVTCLDISGVTDAMAQILRTSADGSEGAEEQVQAAAEQVLSSETPTMQQEITLTFVREDGRWKILPNSALLALLSGFTDA